MGNTPKIEKLPKLNMLLLGTGESGKTTFYKQVKLLHPKGDKSEEEIFQARNTIYSNILSAITIISNNVIKNNLNFDSGNKDKALKIIEIGEDEDSLMLNASQKYTKPIHGYMQDLWKDSAVQEMYRNKAKFHIFDGLDYYFNKINELAPPDYMPSDEDTLYCRKKNNRYNRHRI